VNFLADESVDRKIVGRLRQEKHIVLYVAEIEPGISDEDVLDMANREESFLLTADKDFGELLFRQHRFALGIVLIRLSGLSQTSKAEIVSSAIKKHITELPHAFTVITPDAIRIRKVD